MKKIYILFSMLLVFTLSVYAQNRTVTGVVTGSDDNLPLIGVSVQVKGSTVGAATDVNGRFSIKVTNLQNVVIGVKFIGYSYQEVTLKPGETVVNFKMVPSVNSLNQIEIVAVGYGTQKKVNVLGSVASIKASDVEDLPVANLGSALVNRLPGIGVSIASGKPGAPTTISIRSPTLFTASGSLGLTADPLFVIDGLIATKQDFNDLDASLVESISFLKDASAAIYGAAGDKGVVLITTKKGKPGKAKIAYSGYYGTSDASAPIHVMSAYDHAKMLNDGYDLNNTVSTSRFSQADLNFLATKPYKSWYEEIWHASNLTRHTVNVSGGTEKITFFGGGNYYNEGGNIGDISIKKYGIRSGMTAKVSDDVTAFISLNTTYSTDYRNSLKGSSTDTEDQEIRGVLLTPQWVPLTINGLPNNWAQGPNPPGAWNALALFNSGDYETNTSQGLNLNTSLEYRPNFLKGLTAKVQFGKNNRSGTSKQYFPSYTVYNFTRTGQNSLLFTTTPTTSPTSKITNTDRLQQGTSYSNNYELIGSLDYAKSIKKHTFDLLLVTEQTESTSDSYLTYRDGQQIPGVDQLYAFNASATTVQLNGAAEAGKRSFLGRLNYDYANKYLLQVIARYDGSANFPPNSRWGLFPSVGLGWRVSEEKFFKDHLIDYVNSLKLRANVGLVGDDRVQGFQYIARFTQTTGYLFGSTVTNGLDPNLFPNPNITWEKARTQNYGLDATFLNDRLTFSMDIWNRHTYDGFQDFGTTGVPYTAGIASGLQNYGIQNNWGTEFTIGYIGKVNKDFNFDVNLNFGTSGDQLVQSYYSAAKLGGYTEYTDVPIGNSSSKYSSNNYGYVAKGILRTQADVDALLAKNPNYKIGGSKPQIGYMDFVDQNNDGQINDSDIIPMYESIASKVGFGLTFGLSYKTFKVSINGNLALGGKKFVDSEARKVPTTTQSAPDFWTDHWTPDNPNAKYPRADAPLAKENSTFWAVSGTTSRINNMSMSYSLPKSISAKLGIPDLRILVSGNNLWSIINPFDYKDQNTGSFASYPTLRTYSFGLNVTL